MVFNNVNNNAHTYTIRQGDNLARIAKNYNTTVEAILKLNPQIKNPNLIITGRQLVISVETPFVHRPDYSADNMNLGTLTVDGQELTEIGGRELKSNLYANNLGALSDISLNDANPATKIVIDIQPGKTMTRKDNDTPYSILNKALGDHLDNNSTIVKNDKGELIAKAQWLEKTDLYEAFISHFVNGDNFTGENNRLLRNGENGNAVQIPSVEIDKNGVKYFALQGENGTGLYFDARGNRVRFEDGEIISRQDVPQVKDNPKPSEGEYVQKPEVTEFVPFENGYSDKALNVGNVYVNGQAVTVNPKSNFYTNNVNIFMSETLNDENSGSRLDIQLNPGNNIGTRDLSAIDILKKILGNNFNKSSEVVNADGKYSTVNTPVQNTDLYAAFISEEVNGNNFADNKLVRNEQNFNLVQFPALEADTDGVKYYTLHKQDGTILYFNDKGALID